MPMSANAAVVLEECAYGAVRRQLAPRYRRDMQPELPINTIRATRALSSTWAVRRQPQLVDGERLRLIRPGYKISRVVNTL